MRGQANLRPGTDYAWNTECDCLGRVKSSDPYFLSGGRQGDRMQKSLFFKKKDLDSCSNASKGGSHKRSLRKARQNPLLSPQPKKDINVQHQYYSPPHHFPTQRDHRNSKLVSIREPEMREFSPRISFNFETSFQERIPMVKVASCQNIQGPNHSINQFVYPPIHHNPYSFVPPLKPEIKFRNDRVQPTSERVETLKINIPLVQKQLETQPQTIEQIPSPHNLRLPKESSLANNAPQTKRSIRSRKSQSISINYELEDDIEPEPVKKKGKKESARSKIEKKNYNVSEFQSFRSKIETKKPKHGEADRSKIGGKKAKESKTSLKRINDVEQICSMVDSDEVEEESEESVVLGRLRQYNQFGSAVQPSVSETMPSTQSKLGYQSTTAEKSLLRAFESSHFR